MNYNVIVNVRKFVIIYRKYSPKRNTMSGIHHFLRPLARGKSRSRNIVETKDKFLDNCKVFAGREFNFITGGIWVGPGGGYFKFDYSSLILNPRPLTLYDLEPKSIRIFLINKNSVITMNPGPPADTGKDSGEFPHLAYGFDLTSELGPDNTFMDVFLTHF